jgi:thiamine-phosphate pyrophosphorylase
MSLRLSQPILYLITRGVSTDSTTPDSTEFKNILLQISAAVDAGIDLVQIREKQLTARTLFELTERAVALTRDTKTQILVNDRADIAAGAGADGVHLTTDSIETAIVRKTFRPDFLIGTSTHTLVEAIIAREQGADFAVFGPVYQTASKVQYGTPLGLAKLAEATRTLIDFPVLALGGITIDNAKACLDRGAAGIAGISVFGDGRTLRGLAAKIRSIKKAIS